MENPQIPQLMVAAPASGSGKTAVACALLRALRRRGLDPCAFKCGPTTSTPCFTGRPWMCPAAIWISI